MSRHTGVIKRYSKSKGFGFIEQEGGPDIYAPAGAFKESDLKKLAPGARVTFGVKQGDKGPTALNIVLL